MNVLQFAFGENMERSVHIPHNHRRNSIVYTGTHDNNTLKGWFRHELDRKAKKRLRKYASRRITKRNCNNELIRMAFSSVADTVIIPMQDYLGLDRNARMNKPSTTSGNWTWRMEKDDILAPVEMMIREYARVYGRLG
jgi:4-alpha-glucanotransferase